MQIQLKRIQKVQLELALEVKRVCEKHQIIFFLAGGTLLGAVRHHGFIPWDDDLDIGMMRNEYDKFIRIAQDELSPQYFLQTWETDKFFGLPFAKIRKNATKFVEKNATKVNSHNGIYIDIFPFDNVPASTSLQKKQNRSTYILKRFILAKDGYEVWAAENSLIKRFVYSLISFLAHFISLKFLIHSLLKQMTKYNNVYTEDISSIGSSYGYFKQIFKRELFDDLIELNFENNQLPCPKNYDEYLKHIYGDYMTLPLENKRYNRHSVVEIDFGE
jgi:lipopolysaccharide cholinephosphotransferase